MATGDLDGDGYDDEIVVVFKDSASDLQAMVLRRDGATLTPLWLSGGMTAEGRFSGVQGVQIANVADSLAAVRQAVFDETWLSAGDLLEALRGDYASQENLRQRLINRVPKYGNDDERVDQFAARWGDRYCALVEQYPTLSLIHISEPTRPY